jgi:anti-sigma factor RsiW
MSPDTTDEKLMSLADGELSPGDAAELRRRIDADPALAERFALFVETRALLQDKAKSAEPAPHRLVEAIRRASAGAAPRLNEAAPGPNLRVVATQPDLPERRPAAVRQRPAWASWRLPLAASIVALVVGGLIGYRFAPAPGIAFDGANAEFSALPGAKAAIAEALAATPSGQTRRWSDAASGLTGQVVMVATYRMQDGGACREYEVAADRSNLPRQTIVSCRRGQGWHTQITVYSHPGQGYAPAGGGHEAIEQMLAGLGSRGVVTGEEESQLLRRR